MSSNSSSKSSSLHHIDALKGTENYAVWKIKMIDILTDLDLLEYVDGTKIIPADGNLTAEWKAKDQKALSAIRLCVGDGPLVYIARSSLSKEAWDALQNMYEARSHIGIVTVCRKLFRAQCKDGGNIEEHIRMLRGLVEELVALGTKLSDEESSITLLKPGPGKYA